MRRLLNTLFVTSQGAWLSRDGETVVVHREDSSSQSIPIHLLESIVCMGRVSATPPLMGFCAEKGVVLSFFTQQGRFLAKVDGPVRGNVLLRRQQYRMADCERSSAHIARSVLLGKIANTKNALMRSAREGAKDSPEVVPAARYLSQIARELQNPLPLNTLRGKEGDAARTYFGVFDHQILHQKEDFYFTERNRRPPTDRVNAMLSYVYSLLTHDIVSALEGVGLDPSVGFLHRDRPGRPSLALDLMEEFRPWLADRIVLSLINLKQVKPNGFSKTESGAVVMDEETRKIVIVAWQERKQDELTHPYTGEKVAIGLIPHIQARLLARHIRGELKNYPPYVWR